MLDAMFAQHALLFTVPALLGTVVFVVKLGLMTLGGLGADADVHADVDATAGVDLGHDVEGGDSSEAFKLLSIQSIAAFLMGFGWGGLGGLVGLDWSLPASLAVGAGLGAAFVWLLGLLMKAMYDLEISGNVSARDAVGREASVYASVPEHGAGRGQVRVVIDERARIYNAVSDGEPLPSGTTVRVSRVNDDGTLCVTRA